MHPSLQTRIDPRNGPAAAQHPGAGEALWTKITAQIEKDTSQVRDALEPSVQALEARLANLEAWDKLSTNPAFSKAIDRIMGLEDINRIWASDPDASVERLPVLLRKLNERVGDVETLFQEADRRASKKVDEAGDPRALAKQLYAEDLATDVHLLASLNTDPRLTREYGEIQDKFLREGAEALTVEDRARVAQVQHFCRATGQDPSRTEKATMDLRGKTEKEVLAALSTNYAPGAGFSVQPTVDRQIRQIMSEFSAVIDLANKPATASNRYTWYQETGAKPTVTGGREEVDPTNTTTLQGWKARHCDIFHLVAEVPVTRDQLEDSSFDILATLTDMVGRQMAIQLSTWVFSGIGTDEPLGLSNDGNVPTLNTGKADEATLVSLNLLGATPKAGYAKNGVYILGDDCYKAAIIEVDANGLPKWQPSYRDGSPASLAGMPVYRDTYFDAAASVSPAKVTFVAGNKVAWFGDPKRHFIMPQRRGMLVIRDETKAGLKPTGIEFTWDSRVGFAVDHYEAGAVLVVNT